MSKRKADSQAEAQRDRGLESAEGRVREDNDEIKPKRHILKTGRRWKDRGRGREGEIKVSTRRTPRNASCYSFLVHYQSSLLCMTCFSFPSPSAAAASVHWTVVLATSLLGHTDLPSDYQINAL